MASALSTPLLLEYLVASIVRSIAGNVKFYRFQKAGIRLVTPYAQSPDYFSVFK